MATGQELFPRTPVRDSFEWATNRELLIFGQHWGVTQGSRGNLPILLEELLTSVSIVHTGPRAGRTRGTAVVCQHWVQPRKPPALTDFAAKDQELFPDEFTAAAGQDGRAAGETCPLLCLLVAGNQLMTRLFGSMLLRIAGLSIPAG
ncbi:MAG: hypothetical protein A3F68_05100 [Acidobacteria bacterium RIFCSPLOWO2_12_FULL_54_10]|nr:MAG: hypothetical protein A3F68_05100 [Acidobacteria bacterium RIFCSPLOWO2_12_FULL_54_10]